ncbi:MAG: hypothetical protein JST11_02815 [Acidobacteria bacterium]|nr:hypothetical protein [Acidobacteriota bacterium]
MLLAIPPTYAAGPIAPVTVCEVLARLPSYEGKDLAVIGRYSFRKDGRWVGEQSCDTPGAAPPVLWLVEDAGAGPKPPDDFELDAAALNRKFADMIKRTALGKFRFGTADYDRWAVVYGRIAARKGNDAAKAPADLMFRGSGVVIFLTTEH